MYAIKKTNSVREERRTVRRRTPWNHQKCERYGRRMNWEGDAGCLLPRCSGLLLAGPGCFVAFLASDNKDSKGKISREGDKKSKFENESPFSIRQQKKIGRETRHR